MSKVLGVLGAFSEIAELERAVRLASRVATLGKRYHALRGRIGPVGAAAGMPLVDEAQRVMVELFAAARDLPERGSWAGVLPKIETLLDRADALLVQLEACRVS